MPDPERRLAAILSAGVEVLGEPRSLRTYRRTRTYGAGVLLDQKKCSPATFSSSSGWWMTM